MNRTVVILSLFLFMFGGAAIIPYLANGNSSSLNAAILFFIFGVAILILGLFLPEGRSE